MPERKSGSQAVRAKVSPVPSKRSYSVRLDDDLLAQLRDSPKAERQQIGEAIRTVQENFGRPHQHSGIGIRDLAPKGSRDHVYECRLTKAVRLVFTLEDDSTLYFHMMGTHDQVQRFLRSVL
jgi:mRNA-degrading endonuclease YafQ of YafQ-DinJ toxin-antitoxin module